MCINVCNTIWLPYCKNNSKEAKLKSLNTKIYKNRFCNSFNNIVGEYHITMETQYFLFDMVKSTLPLTKMPIGIKVFVSTKVHSVIHRFHMYKYMCQQSLKTVFFFYIWYCLQLRFRWDLFHIYRVSVASYYVYEWSNCWRFNCSQSMDFFYQCLICFIRFESHKYYTLNLLRFVFIVRCCI